MATTARSARAAGRLRFMGLLGDAGLVAVSGRRGRGRRGPRSGGPWPGRCRRIDGAQVGVDHREVGVHTGADRAGVVFDSVHRGTARGVGREHRGELERLLGEERVVAGTAGRGRQAAVDRDVDAEQRVGAADRPVAAAAHAPHRRPAVSGTDTASPSGARRGREWSARPSAARGSPTAPGCWPWPTARRSAGCRPDARPAGARGGVGAAVDPLVSRAAAMASRALRTARSPSAWKCTWKPSRSSDAT